MSQYGPSGPERDIPPPPDMPSGEALVDEGPPGWPKALGITDISLGAVSLLCMACGIFGLLMPMMFAAQMQQQFSDGLPPAMLSPSPLMYVSMSVGLVLNIFLIVNGIILLLRLPSARMLHLVYAVLALIGFVVSMSISLQHQAAISEWVNQNPNTKFAQQQQASGIYGQIAGWAIGILLGAVWPVFCLIWFGFVKRTPKDMTGEEATSAM